MASIQFRSQSAPGLRVFLSQVGSRESVYTRCSRGHDAHSPPQHQSRRSSLAPGDAPLMVAVGAKKMFQVVVGTGQVRDIIAME